MKFDVEFEENYKELINYILKDDEVWIPYSHFSLFEYFLLDKERIHLNFNIKNLYFIWYYLKNNIELLEESYNGIINKKTKTINDLSTKSDKPIVRASATLVTINNSIDKNSFKLLSEFNYEKIKLYYNETIPSDVTIFQDLNHLNNNEVANLIKLDNKKIITTANNEHLQYFDGYNAVNIVDDYVLWN